MKARRGFTFIEILLVMIVLGILATLAILRYIDLRDKAVAAGISTELNGVRLAAYNYWADHETWPPDAGPGITPPELVDYLPRSFSFSRATYTLDWENFMPPDDTPGPGNGTMQLGLVVTSQSPSLTQALAIASLGGAPFVVAGNTLTYIIVGPNGAM
ncbi:MAG: type II secretion system protein [Gemmatimonadales bacterium]|nr:type II secretion system protein [Gemmatimonadales bacterium]